MRLVCLICRCKTHTVSDRSVSAPGCSAPARPKARRVRHVHRLTSGAAGTVGGSTFSWAAHGAPSDIKQTTRALGTRYRANVVSPRITISTDSSSTRPSPFGEPRCEVRTVTRREMATAMPVRKASRTRQNWRFSLRSPPNRACDFARCVRSHAVAARARSALVRPTTRRQLRRSRGVSHRLPHERVERLSVPGGRHHLCRAHGREASKMAQQKVITSLVVVLAFACAANAGFAQTQATTTNGHTDIRGSGSVRRRTWPRRRVIPSPRVG